MKAFCAFGRSFHLENSKDVDAFDFILENLGYEDRVKYLKDDSWKLDELLTIVGDEHDLIILYGESNTIYVGGDYENVDGSSTFDEFRARVVSILGSECKHINQVIDAG